MNRLLKSSISCTLFILLFNLSAFAGIYRCVDKNGKNRISDIPCPQNTKKAFYKASQGDQNSSASSCRYKSSDSSIFSYKTKQSTRIRLNTCPSDKIVQACLDRHRDLLLDPLSPYVHEAALTERIWNNAQGAALFSIEVILDARVKNEHGAFVPRVLSCPVHGDDSIDETGLQAHLEAFRAGRLIR